MTSISRRKLLLGGAGAAGVGAVGALAANRTASSPSSASAHGDAKGSVPFLGEHQAGIVTAAQDRLYFAAFDVITDDVGELVSMLQRWTAAAAQMTQCSPTLRPGPMNAPEAIQTPSPTDVGAFRYAIRLSLKSWLPVAM